MWKICVPFLPAVNSRENANILRILVRPMCPQAVAILRHLEKLRIGDVAFCRIGAQEPFA